MATKRDEARALLDKELPVGTEVWSSRQGARFQQLTNTSQIKKLRRDIARVRTVQRAAQLKKA